MLINSIVDNNKVTGKIKNVYKFIEKHGDDISMIFATIHNDIQSIFSDVTKDDESIIITISDPDSINSIQSMVKDIVNKHMRDSLGDDADRIVHHVFKIVTTSNGVTILLKK